jgi:preprotein translocase subunit SecY
VIMDFMAQLQAHLMSHQYEGLLKKANLKSLSGGPAGRNTPATRLPSLKQPEESGRKGPSSR